MRKARILRSGDGSIEALFYFILIGCNAMNYFIFWLTIVVRGRVRNMAADYGSTNIDRGSAINVGAITAAKSIASRPDRLSTVLIRVALTEFLVVACTAYLVSLIYNRTVLLRWPPPQEYIPAALFIATSIMLVSLAFGHFLAVHTQTRHRFLWSGLGAVGLTFSLFVSLMFLLQVSEIYSRGTFFLQLITVAISVLTLRAISHTRIQSGIAGGRIEARRTVLIGNSAHCEPISEQLHNSGVRTLRRLPLPATAGKPASEADANSEANAVRRTVEICRKFQPDDILILATTGDLPVITRLAGGLSQLPVTLHMIPMDARDLLGSFSVGELGNLATVQLLGPPLSTFDIVVKRAFDILTACMGIVLFSPLFLIVAAAIKLDSPGPVLFRQTRHGYNNDTIRVLKFRSMRAMAAGEPFEQATRNDPRVTRLGRILRRTNIDEVPQLFNVLTGEMSIVDPPASDCLE